MLEMDITTIFFVLIFGGIGFVYMSYGKKMMEYSFILCGLLLTVFSYVVDGVALTIIIGLVLILGPFILRKYF